MRNKNRANTIKKEDSTEALLHRVEEFIQEYRMIPAGTTVLCAVSGGADSICMLSALYRLRRRMGFQLAVAHYDHQLRGAQSQRDAQFVVQFVELCCNQEWLSDGRKLPAVPLYLGRGDVAAQARQRGTGLEETAREMRYTFLRQTAREIGAARIAVAHSADDNVETVLMHLGRGAGLRGMCGIQPVVGEIIRPLLTTPRREIEQYLQFWGLPHVEDHTNSDVTFTRNRVRHQVTPILEEMFPNFCVRMADTAVRLRRDDAYLEELARKECMQAIESDGGLVMPVTAIGTAHDAIATRMVRQLIGHFTEGAQNCTANHLESVVDLCRRQMPSGVVSLPYGLIARREYDRLRVMVEKTTSVGVPFCLQEDGIYPFGAWHIVCDTVTCPAYPQDPFAFYISKQRFPTLEVRVRQVGDVLKLAGRHTKTVKKWMVEQKIPHHIRDTLPVFCSETQLGAVSGLGVDIQAIPTAGEPAWYIKVKPNKE